MPVWILGFVITFCLPPTVWSWDRLDQQREWTGENRLLTSGTTFGSRSATTESWIWDPDLRWDKFMYPARFRFRKGFSAETTRSYLFLAIPGRSAPTPLSGRFLPARYSGRVAEPAARNSSPITLLPPTLCGERPWFPGSSLPILNSLRSSQVRLRLSLARCRIITLREILTTI